MRNYLIRRLLLLVFVIWGVFSLTFVVTSVTGDPVTLMMQAESSREEVARVKHLLGLDRPLHEFQFLRRLQLVIDRSKPGGIVGRAEKLVSPPNLAGGCLVADP